MIHRQTHRSGIALLTAFVWLMVACEWRDESEVKQSNLLHPSVSDTNTYKKQSNYNCDCDSLKETFDTMSPQQMLFLNKQIIPCLIDCMDINKTSILGFKNPLSSYIGEYHFNQCGIRYAYAIDYILLRDRVETVNKTWDDSENWIHWSEIVYPYRIYDFGVIVKQDENGNPTEKALTHEDMIKIKEMYLEWWEANKEKPIETLRKEFREGNKILKEPYVWI